MKFVCKDAQYLLTAARRHHNSYR